MPSDELAAPVVVPTVDWPPFDRSLLGEARPAPAAFPLHLLPGRWRGWVEASSRVFGSADYLAHCLLAGVSGVCGAGIRIEVAPHWREPLLLWQALVGGPSSGKSAAFARVRTLLASIKPVEDSSDSAAPAVLVDAGLDQLNSALFGSARGVLLWREDLADWMDEARRRPARPAWLAGWNAEPARIGLFSQECFAAGIAGTLTPERLSRDGGGAGFIDGDSALAARFLYVWPERGGAPSLADPGADDDGVTVLLQKIADFAGDRRTPTVVPLDDAAIPRLEQVMVSVQRRADEADGATAEWIAKGVPTIVRLAGLLSLMEWAEQDVEWLPVGTAHIEAAHALWSDYYLPQALRLFDRTGVAGCERDARRVARWLKRVHAPEISREDIRREALGQAVNAEGAEDVLARLEAGGLLRPLPATGSARGGPRRRRWAVHPQVAGGSWRS
jgi:hypothetical protein